MKFDKVTLQTCSQATGLVVVIDVIRAFTTAAFAFAEGVKTIALVGAVDEAFSLRQQIPNSKVMGEVNGIPPGRFDFGNSPSEVLGADLRDKHLIQRTSSGTQGVMHSSNAELLLAASFCNAQATVDYIQSLAPESVTFVLTGLRPDGRGDEDAACAEYLELLLRNANANPEPFLTRVLECKSVRMLLADSKRTRFSRQDMKYCAGLDRFDFAMVVSREKGKSVLKAVNDFPAP